MDANEDGYTAWQRAENTAVASGKAEILTAAGELLKEVGKFSLKELAARAGCSQKAIRSSFGTRDGVVIAVWCAAIEQAFQDWQNTGRSADQLMHSIWLRTQPLGKSNFPMDEAGALEELIERKLEEVGIRPTELSGEDLAKVITSFLIVPRGSRARLSEQAAHRVLEHLL